MKLERLLEVALSLKIADRTNFDNFWNEYSSEVFIFDRTHHFYGDTVLEIRPLVRDERYVLYLAGILVAEEQRGQGKASETLQWLIALCKKHELDIVISPKPFGLGKKMTKAQLIKWYKSFGFEKIDSDEMILRAK